MAAVVAIADGDAFRIEEDQGGVEGGETRGVGETVAVEEGGDNRFETTVVGCCVARVDVGGGVRAVML